MTVTNKEYINKTIKQRAKIFAKQSEDVILHNRKHFILLYEENKNPKKSFWSFDCTKMSAREIVDIFKQIIMSVLRGKKISMD